MRLDVALVAGMMGFEALHKSDAEHIPEEGGVPRPWYVFPIISTQSTTPAPVSPFLGISFQPWQKV
jgi:hypothetical protein